MGRFCLCTICIQVLSLLIPSRPVALSLLTCLHANLDVRPWLSFSEICVNLNLLHRQGRGHRAIQGWQVKATGEGPLLPAAGFLELHRRTCLLPLVLSVTKDTRSQGFWGDHHC